VAQLRAWVAAGAHRRDTNKDDTYENSDAIRVMDAWWPKLVQSEFSATLGGGLVDQLSATDPIDNTPNANGAHLGSAWDVGFYGTVQKDLRRLLHHRVKGPLSRTYCGRGSLVRCQRSLLTSLKQAMAVPTSELYADDICTAAKRPASQTCFDAISFRPLGALTQPLIPWINRPTFQQVVEVQNGR
jgi:hypothetical protein